MKHINFRNGELFVEKKSVFEITKIFKSPFFLYSKNSILDNIMTWKNATKEMESLTCFALKANDNLNIVKLMNQNGLGADVVSAGELFLAREAGVDPKKIVFAGVGKQDFEIEYALKEGIRAFNIESEQELKAINEIAKKMDKTAPIHIRVNPDIDAKSHPYISTGMAKNKFGIETTRAIELFKYSLTLKNILLKGIHVHIGSQLLDLSPFEDCSRALRELFLNLRQQEINLETIDLGGGLGVDYKQVVDWPINTREEQNSSLTVENYTKAILKHLKDLPVNFVFEPGRSMVANSCLLIVSVIFTKESSQKKFVVVNGGMNDLIRPSLYQAYHRILPIKNPVRETNAIVDIVGPICETTDFLAKNRNFPDVQKDEILAVFSTGAYGYSLSSNYNGRPRLAEVWIDEDKVETIRRAETYEDLIKLYE